METKEERLRKQKEILERNRKNPATNFDWVRTNTLTAKAKPEKIPTKHN